MFPASHIVRRQFLAALIGLIALAGMTPDAAAQCQWQKLLASDGAAGDQFGVSVAISGGTAVIGAHLDDDLAPDSGSAYVFEQLDGVWSQTARLTADDGAAFDSFGRSVAVSGDTAAIGANLDDDQGTNSGSTYIFEKIGGVWSQTAKLTADDGAEFDLFGISVAISGETAIIGASRGDGQEADSGSAYVFEKIGGVWTQTAKLSADDGVSGDKFGASVTVSGETVFVGGYGVASGSGSAYVFEKIDGVWSQTAKLTAADAAAGDWFGSSVALSGDAAVIGAPFDDGACSWPTQCESGSAYVFEKIGGVWTQTAKLTASDTAVDDWLGISVALSGETAVIGASNADGQQPDSGSAYVFEKIAGVWTQTAKLTAADAAAVDWFGTSVAVSSGVALIGARSDDDMGQDSGSVYPFVTSGDDCNANGIPDECELVSSVDFVHQSREFSPFSSFWVGATEVIPAPPLASGNVILTVEVKADLYDTNEFVHVSLNGLPFGRLFESDGAECPTAFDMSSLVIAEASFNALLPGDVTVDLVPSTDVNTCAGVVKLRLSYTTVGTNDCNGNGIPDDCDIDDGVSMDCNANSIPDDCEVDCNTNGIPDECDIGDGVSNDCNENSIPDDCEEDCNNNGVPDDCDIDAGVSNDCNENSIPDDCDVSNGASSDCNTNGIPDACEADCNTNGTPDECDISEGTSNDCSTNGIPDECEEDCNTNGIPDDCDIDDGVSMDCNENSIPDDCETDGDGDGVIDDCDNCALPNPPQEDCNNNGIGDACEMPRMLAETFSGGMFNSVPGVTWTNPSTSPGWFFTDSSFSLPGDVIQSVDIANSGTTAMSALLDFGLEGGSVSFDWAVQSQSYYDRLLFSIDGSTLLDRSGEQSGSSSFPVGAGSHRFEWRYSKDYSYSVGADASAIDNVIFDIPFDLTQDCNTNGVLDECDIDAEVSNDCNSNGVPDECELVPSGDFVHTSNAYSPFQFGMGATEVIPVPPIASGDVTLTVEVKADLNLVSEFVDVFLNGLPLGRLFESDGGNCPLTFDVGSLAIAEARFNALLPGDLTVDLVPSTAVNTCGWDGIAKLRLSYTSAGNDCNDNDIPDDCDTDGDGDGVIDDCDPCPLDNPNDADGDGVCTADDLCPDTPLGLLVDADGCTLMVGPCCFPGPICIEGAERESCEAFPDGVFQGEGLTCGDPDADGVFGCSDGCPLDPAKTDPGVCGCGVPDDDGDLDGIADCEDLCGQTPTSVPVNVCGCTEVGACCAAGGGCFDDTERTVCLLIAGIYQGDGSTCADNCALGDLDDDGDVDMVDFAVFERCFTAVGDESPAACPKADVDRCGSVDIEDFAVFRAALTGP